MRRTLLCLTLMVLSTLCLSAQGSIEHKVKWFEDAKGICNRYGISMEDLLKANTLHYPSDVKVGMTLIIPKKTAKSAAQASGESNSTVRGTVASEINASTQPTIQIVSGLSEKPDSALMPSCNQHFRIGIALPLNASVGGNVHYTDFYGGALLAIEEMSLKDKISVDLTFLDTKEDNVEWNKMKGCDFVIGPVSAKDLKEALRVLPRDVYVVSPLDPQCEELLPDHCNLIQAPTPAINQWSHLVSWIKGEFNPNDKFLVLYEKGGKEEAPGSAINAVVDSCGIQPIKFSYSILEGRKVDDKLKASFTEQAEAVNRVIIASDNQAFVNDAVRILRILKHKKYNVVLYAPSRIKSFETIEVENLHSLSMRMSATYNVDYDNPSVQHFLLKYRALYNTEPSAFAFQGYDLMKYMLILKSGSPDNWESQAISKRIDLLQESFLLKKQGQGWINSATRGVIYGPGYNLEMYNNQFISLNNEHE